MSPHPPASTGLAVEKQRVREYVWSLLEQRGVALPPLPCRGRVPNFRGADVAALRLRGVKEYVEAEVVLVNPDSPQFYVRRMALLDGKKVLMPTPRLKRGFLLIDPARVKGRIDEASTIRGAFIHGVKVPSVGSVDFVVEGSVAVDLDGHRLGKGGGYGDVEIRMAREANPGVKVATTVHSLQVLPSVPAGEGDEGVDYIATERALYVVGGVVLA
ncbi:MAG: 5-formyltetrahydrofolate cyclo-ligase [Candidatus Nezhaarchaeota archaeon]|nr:5-formyltetrahydrofolate cyclo-ligase [Candidatus Nezhaarchaeota archaeon]